MRYKWNISYSMEQIRMIGIFCVIWSFVSSRKITLKFNRGHACIRPILDWFNCLPYCDCVSAFEYNSTSKSSQEFTPLHYIWEQFVTKVLYVSSYTKCQSGTRVKSNLFFHETIRFTVTECYPVNCLEWNFYRVSLIKSNSVYIYIYFITLI